jgi:formylglycine-generating enzyme required for sulfatase activity/serine/threonine protein kinase
VNTLAGRYEIIQQLGGGSFAMTYIAQDNLQPSKPLCVVKQLHPHQNHPRVVEFFEKEAIILERLGKHPQIPQLLAHLNENQRLYIVQEFIEGQDLGQEIKPSRRLSEDYVLELLKDVLEVLSFVHSHGVIHRDIKPQNLMRRTRDKKICLIDFGAVKELGTLMMNKQGEITSSIVIGSSGYMPNEQKNGKPILASDIYALGMTAIQALTGIIPNNLPEDPDTGEIIWRDQAQVSDYLAEVLTKMVRRHFSLRYPSAREVLAALTTPSESLIATNVLAPSPQEEYYQEATKRIQQNQGNFSVFALKILESKRLELGLTDNETKAIHAQVIQNYRQYQQKLQEYEQALIVAINQQYPFNQATQKDLEDYRQYLGLRLEDILSIEARVLAPKMADYDAQQQPLTSSMRQPHLLRIEAATIFPELEPTQIFEFETAALTYEAGNWQIQRRLNQAEVFKEYLGNSVVLDLVRIPGGKFLLGSPEHELERNETEGPQQSLTIQPFYMGKFPITQAQWATVAAWPKVEINLQAEPSHFKGGNRPVEQVSWHDASEFCARLSRKTGRNYRLPSEAEWEYACRAGTDTPFYCGETITTDLANYNGKGIYGLGVAGEYRQQTNDIGIFPANAFGLYDMHGNVWEWSQDHWHDNYTSVPIDGLPWEDLDSYGGSRYRHRSMRGGSWYLVPVGCRSASRDRRLPGYKHYCVGFRVVCSGVT